MLFACKSAVEGQVNAWHFGGNAHVEHTTMAALQHCCHVDPLLLLSILSGNDARFTMEAFLSLAGLPACADPAGEAAKAQVASFETLSLREAQQSGWGGPVTQPGDNSTGQAVTTGVAAQPVPCTGASCVHDQATGWTARAGNTADSNQDGACTAGWGSGDASNPSAVDGWGVAGDQGGWGDGRHAAAVGDGWGVAGNNDAWTDASSLGLAAGPSSDNSRKVQECDNTQIETPCPPPPPPLEASHVDVGLSSAHATSAANTSPPSPPVPAVSLPPVVSAPSTVAAKVSTAANASDACRYAVWLSDGMSPLYCLFVHQPSNPGQPVGHS